MESWRQSDNECGVEGVVRSGYGLYHQCVMCRFGRAAGILAELQMCIEPLDEGGDSGIDHIQSGVEQSISVIHLRFPSDCVFCSAAAGIFHRPGIPVPLGDGGAVGIVASGTGDGVYFLGRVCHIFAVLQTLEKRYGTLCSNGRIIFLFQ